MHVEFRKALVPDELRDLMAFDRKVFPKADLFRTEDWIRDGAYWMLLDGAKIGCCAFQSHRDFTEDIRKDGRNIRRRGSLYITTTGILPRFQNRGFGKLLKVWQIAYARSGGFERIVTNCRMRNRAILGLNQSLGYRFVRATERYYSGPVDATVVMEFLFVTSAVGLTRRAAIHWLDVVRVP
jgi:GNAT superfamily N-acetyltransferase